jgi:tRNA1Val (adenine37-N6)-methyltransferase
MVDLSLFPSGGETLDTLFGGQIRVVQARDGYRFSIDAVLVAGFVWLKGGERIVDLGTGVGIIPLILGKRRANVEQIVGVELQEELTALARRNVLENGLEGLITIYQGDIKGLRDVFAPACFDVVVTNPPYYRVASGRINPRSQKAVARHEVTGTIDNIVHAARYLLTERGRMFVVYPAQRSVALLNKLRDAALEPKRIRWVHSREGEGAKFILTEAQKGGGEGVEVLPPLFVYSAAGVYTSEMETLYSIPLQS